AARCRGARSRRRGWLPALGRVYRAAAAARDGGRRGPSRTPPRRSTSDLLEGEGAAGRDLLPAARAAVGAVGQGEAVADLGLAGVDLRRLPGLDLEVLRRAHVVARAADAIARVDVERVLAGVDQADAVAG